MEKIAPFAVVLLLFISVATEQPDSSFIDEAIQDSFSCRKNNPALSVSIVKDGKIVFSNGYGVLSLTDQTPVTNATLFGIASLTKAFTSAILAKITEKSTKYSLNSRVTEFYGNHNVFDGYLRAKFATIRDLLSHRMGIPMHNFIRFDSKLTRKNLIRRLKELRPKGRFRDSFYYSNIMYGQAARLAEKISRKKYEDLIHDELFRKLGMSDSDFFTTANKSSIELAKGYIDVYGEIHPVPFELSRRWSELCGANCILSSATDMAKWMLFHLSRGKNQDGRRVMSEEAIEETHKPENVLAKSSLSKYFTKPNVPVTFSQTGYALGWRTGHYRGYNVLTHTGSSWGYKNMISLFPDANLGIYTAMTGDDKDFMFRYSLHQYLADMYMGLTPWLNSSLICSFPEPWFPAKPKRIKPSINKNLPPQRNLEDYLGVYENPAYGNIEIFILDEENSTNKLIAEYGYVDLILYPKSKLDEFFFETDGIAAMLINFGTLQFKASSGIVDRMRIPSFEPKDPPIFKRVDRPPKSIATAAKQPVDGSSVTESSSLLDNVEVTTSNTKEQSEKQPNSVNIGNNQKPQSMSASKESNTALKDGQSTPDTLSTSNPKISSNVDNAGKISSVKKQSGISKTVDNSLSKTNTDQTLAEKGAHKATNSQNTENIVQSVSKSQTTREESLNAESVQKRIRRPKAIKKKSSKNTVSVDIDQIPKENSQKKLEAKPRRRTTELKESAKTKDRGGPNIEPVVDSGKLAADVVSTKRDKTKSNVSKDKQNGNPSDPV